MKKMPYVAILFLILTNPMRIWAQDEVGCICLEWTQTFEDFFRFIPPDMAFGHLDEERIAREQADRGDTSAATPSNDHDRD